MPLAAPDPDDLDRVRHWFEALAVHVRAVDFAAARPLFDAEFLYFGTFSNFVTGREHAEAAQREVWPTIEDFRWRLDDVRAIVSADRLTAVGLAVFDSTGFHPDGATFERPGRATVAFARRRIGDAWTATHTHMSLFRGVPAVSHGAKPGAG